MRLKLIWRAVSCAFGENNHQHVSVTILWWFWSHLNLLTGSSYHMISMHPESVKNSFRYIYLDSLHDVYCVCVIYGLGCKLHFTTIAAMVEALSVAIWGEPSTYSSERDHFCSASVLLQHSNNVMQHSILQIACYHNIFVGGLHLQNEYSCLMAMREIRQWRIRESMWVM